MDLAEARERMVIEQLERRGIKDPRVLAAMRSVARDRFIPPEYADHAYDDGPLPIGSSQTISQSYMVALMSEVAALTGSGRGGSTTLNSLQPRPAQCGKMTLQHCRIFDRHSLFVHCQRKMRIKAEQFGCLHPRFRHLA